MTVTLALLSQHKPIIHIPREGPSRELIDVTYELREKYAILWYHWPFDDYSGRADYEPVILFFDGAELKGIGIRPHTQYKQTESWQEVDNRPVIQFFLPWHGPIILKGGVVDPILGRLKWSRTSKRVQDYPISEGSPPDWFISDGTDLPVYEYANSVARELGI